jgi:hypothetical protein
VPNDYKESSASSAYLDKWIAKQRTKHRLKELSMNHRRLLEEVGLDINGRKQNTGPKQEERWEGNFSLLLSYKEEHGDCSPPKGVPVLGMWVKQQRMGFRQGKLKEWRIQRLLSIGFLFDPLNKWGGEEAVTAALPPSITDGNPAVNTRAWSSNFKALKTFVETNGHVNVPPLYKDEAIEGCLHAWVETQKRFFRKGNLPSQQAKELEELGVDFINVDKKADEYAGLTKNEVAWKTNCDRLAMFHRDHGHSNVSDGCLLRWSTCQTLIDRNTR